MERVGIRPYSPGDAEAVIELVLTIQRGEFGMAVTVADQPELSEVERFYRSGSGNFWVAVVEGDVVGTIGLLDIGNGDGALRKMFVRKDWRRREPRIAESLLETLLKWSRLHGIRRIYLGTTAWFHAAHRFYAKHGFTEISRERLPSTFPVMAVDSRFYRLELKDDVPKPPSQARK